MKIIEKTYQHKAKGFKIKVTTCNKKIATTENIDTGEIIKFNRGKFEWMIQRGIFKELEAI